MRCPKCGQQFYLLAQPCRLCEFNGKAETVEQWNHITWLLNEVDTWQWLYKRHRESIQRIYLDQQKELEIQLGLRRLPFTDEEAREAWPRLYQAELLFQKVGEWLKQGWLDPVSTQSLVDQTEEEIVELKDRLAGRVFLSTSLLAWEQLSLTNFLLEQIEHLAQQGSFVSLEAKAQALGPLLAEQEALELKLGLRPEPAPIPEEIPAVPMTVVQEAELLAPVASPTVEEVLPVQEIPPQPTSKAPAKPAVPFRERLWQMLLSERALQGMLFLGIFLLFSAALSFVAWGWKDFSAPLRVAIPTGFTGVFFTLGWYVRTKTPMYRSGIALSAIAALLVPIDFYTVYINFHVPPNYWPLFWLITSIACLIAYTGAALVIQSRFFGYLVGTAAGSAILALVELGHQHLGISTDWQSSGLSVLALGLIILSTTAASPNRTEEQRQPWRIFTEPFRYLSLLAVSVIMLLTFGWRFTQREGYDTLHYALTLNWWLGGFIFGWGAIQYRSRGLGLLAAITLPGATYLAQAALFNQGGVSPAWHAFGWALLVPLYLIVGYKLLGSSDPVIHGHGRTATGWSVALILVAMLWPLTRISDGAAASASHIVLAGAIVLAALLWRRPGYLYWASLLSFSAMTFAMTELNLSLAQLSVGWTSLAIAHLILALSLGTQFPIPTPAFAAPLVTSGYLIAAVALAPPLFPYQGGQLAYALGNWIALAGWGSYLAHLKQPGFVGRGLWRKPVFHWLTVLPLPAWVWILFAYWRPVDATLPLALVILAWGLVLMSYRLQRVQRAYRWPWYLTGLLVSIIAPISAFAFAPTGFAPALTLLLAGLLYLTDAVINRQSLELAPGGLVTGWGYFLLLDRLQLSPGAIHLGMAGLIALYFLGGWWASRRNPSLFTRQFLQPLYLTAHFFTLVRLIAIYIAIPNAILSGLGWPIEVRLWGAASQLLLALVYAFYTWTSHKERWGHLAAWLGAGALVFLGLVLIPPATSLATLLALVAFFFILVERALYEAYLLQKTGNRQRAFLRFTWGLYHRPLQVTAWVISAGAISVALFYNVWGFRNNPSAETWAVVALLLVTSLYALSAWLFRQVRFVWLAAYLSFVPWTLLTHLGWWLLPQPSLATYLLSWAGLGWLLFLIHLGLKRLKLEGYVLPLRAMSHSLLLLCVVWSLLVPLPDNFIPALGILAIGLLYFADAIVNRQFLALVPGELLTTWGCFRLVEQFNVSFDGLSLTLTVLVAFYILTGLWVEQRRYPPFDRRFLTPLYLTAHLLALVALGRIYLRPFNDLFLDQEWTDEMRLWGAAGQLTLGLAYGLYSWNSYRERWGHVAAWLGALSGGFIALAFSSGRGSSAAKVALLAIGFVLVERGLHWLKLRPRFQEWYQSRIQLAWPLYRRPLLITGWTLSGVTILLALVRNLWLLDGGWIQQVWAAMGLLLVVALYALSARLFKQPRFLWLAAPLSFAPWTILTHLGWFTPYQPSLAGYALSWAILSWLLLLLGLSLKWQGLPRYAAPLIWVAQGLMPFSLLWGIADIATSRFTFGLAVGFYILSAWADHRQGAAPGRFAPLHQTKYFYPALGFLPVWSLYLLAWFFPGTQPEHYGLLLLLFAPLGLIVGQWLSKVAAQPEMKGAYGLPAYLVAYLSLSVGTLLGAGQSSLLAVVLLFDALLLIISARLFKQPAWLYPAVILLPLSLLISLGEAGLALNRYGLWLIGLSSIYLGATGLLRRLKLNSFATAPLAAGLALIALSLPFSSLDQNGALWGYGAAVLLYALTAFWLRQPLLLTLASALIIIPYTTLLERLALRPDYFGLALFLGAILAWVGGWLLDYYYGALRDFPWGKQSQWLGATVERLVGWWAFSPYLLGSALAVASPLFVGFREGFLTFLFFGQALLFGWAIYRFRLRGWLVGVALAGHLGVIFLFATLGWWANLNAAQIGLRLFPLTAFTLLVALAIEKYRGETPRIANKPLSKGWSYPLYIIADIDIMMGLFWGLIGPAETGAWLTLFHVILLAFLASARLSSEAGYLSLGLASMALTQWVAAGDNFSRDYPIALAALAFLFGLGGYSLALFRQHLEGERELRPWLGFWELPLQRSGLLISFGTLVLAGWLGLDLVGWTLRALLGLPFREIVELETVRMSVGVLSLLGLLYLAAALAHQWARLGYVALGMLLGAWMLHILFILNLAELRQLHWYIIPAGLYLTGVAYLEWHQGNKGLSRWLDYVTLTVLLGTLFWQTLVFGWGHALLLGGIGLLAFFWGIGRRLRRFLYAGMVATMLATVGQLVNSFWSINQWIVFGLVGTLLILVAIIVERKLEDIKIWQEVLESWE